VDRLKELQEFIPGNTKLIFFALKKYFPNYKIDEDLFQEAVLGILENAKYYDSKKMKISTFITITVKFKIYKYLSTNSTFKLSQGVANDNLRINKILKVNPESTVAEIAERLNIKTKRVEELMDLPSCTEITEHITNTYSDTKNDELFNKIIADEIVSFVLNNRKIKEKDKLIFLYTYGLKDVTPMETAEIAKLFCVSVQAIYQTLKKINKQIKDKFNEEN